MPAPTALALFDFDGTISTKDSYLLFTRFLQQKSFIGGCLRLSPRILCFLVRLYANDRLKEDFLRAFYKGKTIRELNSQVLHFTATLLPSIIRPKAMERIRWHQNRGDLTVVVSACPRLILEPWCKEKEIPLIATEIEADEQSRITGKILGKNCRGREKVARIRDHYKIEEFDEVFAYGDSSGDFPMLALADADKRFYKPFR